jgi:hypothetical protein
MYVQENIIIHELSFVVAASGIYPIIMGSDIFSKQHAP